MAVRAKPVTAADVIVVGAGIAGASVAWELAHSARVVLVEREAQAGLHSTGRSAAVLTETTGPAVVRALARASRPFLEQPPDGFADRPLVTKRPVLWIGTDAARGDLDRIAGEWERTATGVRRIDTDEAQALVPQLRRQAAATAVLEPDGLDIDVDALLQAYLRGLRRRGGTVVTGASVARLVRLRSGWRVELADGRSLTAAVVVNAAGAWADPVAVAAGVRAIGLDVLRRTAFVFPAGDDVDVRDWPLVMDSAERFYVKPEGGLLMGSPADETPTEPCDARAEEIDVALGIERIEAAFEISIRTVKRSWAGLRTFAPDRGPVAGPDPEEPSFVWLAGQGGYGVKTAPALARLTAALALDDTVPQDLAQCGIDAAALAPERFLNPN